MRGTAHSALALVLTSGVAGAAPRAAASPPPAAPDVFLGYSHTAAGDASLNGIGVSGSHPVGRRLSFVIDLTGHKGSFAGADLSQLGLMAGVRFQVSRGRFRPFAEGLLGGVHSTTKVQGGGATISESDSDWGFAFGGGLDYELGRRWSARGLFHLRLLQGGGVWDADPRFAIGAVYRFGR